MRGNPFRTGPTRLGLICLGWILLAGCVVGRAAARDDVFRGRQTNTGPEHYASWFGDSDGHVFYFGLSPFWQASARCQKAGGRDCALADLEQPGDHLIGRFDLEHARFLDSLVVRPLDPKARSSVWDVLVHSNGRIYYTTGWDEFGSVRRDGSDVRHYAGAGAGLNELWEGPEGEIYVTRYCGSHRGAPDESGAVAVFGPDGQHRRELPFKKEDGASICPKSVAVDPHTRDIWVNSDVIRPSGGPTGYETFRLSSTGQVLERFASPSVDFLSFDAAGRGWFAENTGGRFVVRIASPDGSVRRLDLGAHGPIDVVQDIKHFGRVTLLATWGLTVYLVRELPDGKFETKALHPPRPTHCPPSPVLGYTAVLAPRGEIYESVNCGIMVVRATDIPATKGSRLGSKPR